MDALDVSRWQFGITTVYHFILVPLTIGLAPMIAIMQTVWHVTGNEQWLRATKFFGKLFLINFALGVATGIVQEFQFGMNWSEYSRFVADVFGAPLALEGLVAFFLESTFIGLWIFGWGRLPRKVHLACIWLAAIGVTASAYFIIAANSWMQHPVGVEWDPERGRPAMNDFWAVITNNTTLAAFPHVLAGAWLTAGTFVAAVGIWWMARNTWRAKKLREAIETGDTSGMPKTTSPSQIDATPEDLERDARQLWRPVTRFSLWIIMISGVALFITGDLQAQIMFKQQPMKMASAESLCDSTTAGAPFSVLSIGRQNNCDNVDHVVEIPGMLSFLADHRFDTPLQGVNQLQVQYQEALQMPGQNFAPNLFVTYWGFRAMITWALGSVVVALGGLWLTRRKRVVESRRFGFIALLMIPTPFLANSSGWIFTEMGRQPWVVAPNWQDNLDPTRIHMLVADGVSNHTAATVWVTLIGFTLLYGALGVVWFMLQRRYVIEGPATYDAIPPDEPSAHDDDSDEPKQLSFAY
ncbi:cytochrome bd ubiquinol oxidase subunit I [Gordonia bronchialis DSM 43247]|uniref:Cytochrome bd ubiquinol oxidase subunit I n=1 Tax=Gordonia bronchialis (strain ATCC 25592 / DSM 43247 / BCRC 13721 / JCM 3198 / KCTC 3076 / NBRC 16047 / NCTC 10667) TaxID=526226 RepID=D0L441_GORB4|nr:cytochrome ubiquinol oxidase subunit I [Gordonia bronchialis]ACY20265.1 cytochrome bd ubiquinol oxidase subunit I [Gordonia bronchialis DSM 43247]MCC3323038.1 cytochrome ubiquinol oxidase subunit I [Gordonia bronchialis]QGS25918.1 cytochrome ubiquinol oxidase subunit I [Gordonia bronchialis]STQ63068.1 Cytochrome bd-II oxidase subunit 1 [Gordonia bronchialis]